MYAVVTGSGIRQADEEAFWEQGNGICVLDEPQWEKLDAVRERFNIPYDESLIHFCKLENHAGYLYATLKIPPKQENDSSKSFRFYMWKEYLIFVDNAGTVCEQAENILQKKLRDRYTLGHFLYDFFAGLLEDDLLFLQELEREIAKIEEQVLRGCCPQFNIKVLGLKKKISKFYRYYMQLSDIGQELYDNEMGFFEKESLRRFDRLRDRALRLAGETQVLRDYTMQVQEVYQSEIGIRQNDVMKMLTVVTTIFLPLTLIAGWYGMNFAYMPELGMKYAYPVVIGISVLIIVLSLLVFKKKRYW